MQASDIHPKRVEFLNKEAIRVAALLQPLDEPISEPSGYKGGGSVAHLNALELGPFDGPIIHKAYDTLSKGKVVAIKSCTGRKCIGYDVQGYREFTKLVNATCKESIINELVNEAFVLETAFSWALQVSQADDSVSYLDFLAGRINEKTDLYKIYFPIINLHISNFFRIGNAEFIYFTREHINKIVSSVVDDNPNYIDGTELLEELSRYSGQVFVSCTVVAEQEKAVEIAFKRCALALDVLKSCSRVTIEPGETAGFDIDSRVRFTQRSEVLFTKANDMSEFTITMNTAQFPYAIDSIEWANMLDLGLKSFSDFLLRSDSESNELISLIISSIERYANALSEKDLHKRVVELYTILESLLLKNENSPIIDSVAKYLVMLIEKNKENRYQCASHIKGMYKVRSGLVHHAKRVDFSTGDLKKLQLYVFTLLHNLIIKSEVYSDKKSLLTDIDDALMGAF
jgi:hypothetical protein